ncbi:MULTISPECIES: hypothetical protein [Clavibacter]|uniref:Uncharacterized protein n=1 Tax=Clavibacter seminis TaxID=2860285 RepID=A0ABY3T9Y6_9MICO|nr:MULTISPECIES: hypothetical protein [Clavibacter]KDP92367.1 hypothetical protein W824_02105 [Clavibacter cf. michiganensis LMG 26808]UKF24498.1 hypothetical protein KYT88_12310 [Clavibacter sp. A6099]
MPAAPAARSGGVRAVTRAGHVLTSLAMGILLAVMMLGLALDGSLRRLDERD